MSVGLRALTIAAALGCGTVGGVFFAFSAFVMDGLSRVPPAQGMATMQSINVSAVRPAFMTALFGTAAACTALIIAAARTWGDRPATLVLSGSALYLLGTVGLTIVHHVPLNNALAAVDPLTADAAAQWSSYLESWTRANHVRAGTALASAATLILALVVAPA